MRFMFGSKRRGGLSFTALDGDTDHDPVKDDESYDARSADFEVNKSRSNKKKSQVSKTRQQEITREHSWRDDGSSSSVGTSHDLNVTTTSHYTAESFYTAKSVPNKNRKKFLSKQQKELGYTKTVNKPLKTKVNRDIETNTSFAQIEFSVASGLTTDTAKKKKRLKQLFSAFKRKKKKDKHKVPEEDPVEVKVAFHQPRELTTNTKKDDIVDYSENVFAMDVSSMDADDSGFISLDASKEWTPQEFYSFENEDISEMLANIPTQDTSTAIGADLWTPSDQLSFDHILNHGHITNEIHNTSDAWNALPSSSGDFDALKPSYKEPSTTHVEDKTSSLLPEITDDKDDEKLAKYSALNGFGQAYTRRSSSRSSSVYTSSDNDSDSSSSRELDFSNDSRLHHSTSSRMTLGMMAQISGLVDRSTLTSNTGETTQYGSAYTYEVDDTFDSQDDEEIAKALLRSFDSNDLAVIPDIEVIDGHINHAPPKEDESPFQTNVSEIDIFGLDTSADISSLMDSDPSLFHSHDSDKHMLENPINVFDIAEYEDSYHHENYDQGEMSAFEKHVSPVREETKWNHWAHDFKSTKETIQPKVEWPETPIKKVPESPMNRGGVSPNRHGSTLENLETSFPSIQSSPRTRVHKAKAVSRRIRLHHDLLLNRNNATSKLSDSDAAPELSDSHSEPKVSTSHAAPKVSTSHAAPKVSTSHAAPKVSTSTSSPATRPFFWRSHPTAGEEEDIASPTSVNQRSKVSRKSLEIPKKVSPPTFKTVESNTKKVVPSTKNASVSTTNTTESNPTGSIAWKRALFESKSRMNMSSPLTKAQTFMSSIKQSPLFEQRESWKNHPKTPLSNDKKKIMMTDTYTYATSTRSSSPKIPNVVASTPDSAVTNGGSTYNNHKNNNTSNIGWKSSSVGIPPFIEPKPMHDDAISGVSNSIADRISAFESISNRSHQSSWVDGTSSSSSSLKDKMPSNSHALLKLKNMGKNVCGLWY